MEAGNDLFSRFGGVRPMARELGIGSGTVMAWKRSRRVPSKHQTLVLETGRKLGLDISAEDVLSPFPEDRAAQ